MSLSQDDIKGRGVHQYPRGMWSLDFAQFLKYTPLSQLPEGRAETATLYQVGPRISQFLPGTRVSILHFDDHIFSDLYQGLRASSSNLLKLRTEQLVSSTAFRLEDSTLKCRVPELPRIVAFGALSDPFTALDELIPPTSEARGAAGRVEVLRASMKARFEEVLAESADKDFEKGPRWTVQELLDLTTFEEVKEGDEKLCRVCGGTWRPPIAITSRAGTGLISQTRCSTVAAEGRVMWIKLQRGG